MIPTYMLHYNLPIIGARYTRFVQEIRFSNTYIHMDCFTNQITDSIWGSNEWVDIYQIVIDRNFLLFRLLKCLLLWSSYLLCVGFPTIYTLSTLITIKKLSQCHSFNMFTWDFIGWQCQMPCWILLFTIGWMLGMWYFKYLLVFLIG